MRASPGYRQPPYDIHVAFEKDMTGVLIVAALAFGSRHEWNEFRKVHGFALALDMASPFRPFVHGHHALIQAGMFAVGLDIADYTRLASTIRDLDLVVDDPEIKAWLHV